MLNPEQYINKIIDKKRSSQHKNLFKPLKTKQEIINSHNPNHWIISEIPHIKWFTEPFPDFPAFVKEMKEQDLYLIPIIDAGVKVEKGYVIQRYRDTNTLKMPSAQPFV